MPHYVTLSLNNISAFSFPATANQQPTGGANGNGNASASENVDNNDTQQTGSINSPPVQEEQGEEIDQHEETKLVYMYLSN